eukprot:m.20221 g.20221  ORF g.20221 m.20221 type:complete len:222 (+) comp3512_c1_seq1:51-716(+)
MSNKRSGPVIGSPNAPLVSTAGADHVIFSKKLLISIAVVFLLTGVIFFWIEQTRISRNIAASRSTIQQNNAVKAANEQLEKAKLELQAEEDELVNMYSQWFQSESSDMQMSEQQLAQLKEKFKAVQQKIQDHTNSLNQKEASLKEQEERLKAFQYKIQQKQLYIEQLSEILNKLNVTVPKGTGIDESVGDFTWDDDIAPEEGFDFQNVDDDWMNDGAGEEN